MPMTLLIMTMWPFFLLFMSGRTSFSNRTNPKKLVSITVFISSIGWHSMGPIRPISALLTVRERHSKNVMNDCLCMRNMHSCTCSISDCIEPNVVGLLKMSTLRSCRLSTLALMEASSQHPTVCSPKSCPEFLPQLPQPVAHSYLGSSWWHRLQQQEIGCKSANESLTRDNRCFLLNLSLNY